MSFHDGSRSPWRWRTCIGPHNLFSFTNSCGSSSHCSSKWGVEGGPHRQGVTAMSPLSSLLWAESWSPLASMTSSRREACSAMPGNTQNLMFQSSLWKLDNCPSVSLYVSFTAARSGLWPHMCFFIGCCKLENIKSFGFGASLKMISV